MLDASWIVWVSTIAVHDRGAWCGCPRSRVHHKRFVCRQNLDLPVDDADVLVLRNTTQRLEEV